MGFGMSETVTVACKVPNGLNLGGRIVNGCAHDPFNKPDYIYYGYALTRGFPANIWDAWLKSNANSHMVQNNIVFADADENAVKSKINGTLGGPRRPRFA